MRRSSLDRHLQFPKVFDWRVLREEKSDCPGRRSERIIAHRMTSWRRNLFIRPRRDFWLGLHGRRLSPPRPIRPKDPSQLDTLEAIAVMVDQGLGVSLIYDWAPPWPEGLSLRKLPLPENWFGRQPGASLEQNINYAFG